MRPLLVVFVVAACSVPAPAAVPEPTPSASGFAATVSSACGGSSYTRCVEKLTMAFQAFRGITVAICEYPAGDGDIVTVEPGDTADEACSDDGYRASKVHGTVTLPPP
jgi:hypothetical protein